MLEMNRAVELHFPDHDLSHSTDLLSGTMNSAMGVAMALWPLTGSLPYKADGLGSALDATVMFV